MKKQKQGKPVLSALLWILILAGLFYLVFHRNYREILANLSAVGWKGLCVLVAAGLIYEMLESAANQMLLRVRVPEFTFRQSAELTALNAFGRTSIFGMGAFALQGYYLNQCGMLPGDSAGTVLISYNLHKVSVLACAAGLFLWQGIDLLQESPNLVQFVLLGFLICTAIVLALLLVCTWDKVRQLMRRLLDCLPRNEKWQCRKEKLMMNVDAMYRAAYALKRQSINVWAAFAFHSLKLLWMDFIPVLCLHMMGISTLTTGKAMGLAALCLVLAGACPNVAGIGPTELAFLMLYGPCVGQTQASSLLILFRCATYFFPFLIGAGVSRCALKRVKRENASADGTLTHQP